MYVVEFNNNRVQQFSGTTYTSPAAIGGTSSGTGNYQFNRPVSVVADKSGNIYVTDQSNDRVMKYSPSRSWQGTWSLPGTSLTGITYSAANDWIFVADGPNKKIYVYSTTGSLLGSWTARGTPSGLAVDSAGFLYVVDRSYYCFDKYTPDGRLVCSVGSQGDAADQFRSPYDIALDSSNNVYVVDYTKGTLQKFK
jgi:tripartite motif-containing protein 71